VLEDVDASLVALLGGRLPEGTTVSLEPPRRAWARRPPEGALVNAYLYDVREDVDGRKADWDDIRDERGRVVGRQPPPRRYELSYLVSAWAGDVATEHGLLGTVLALPGTGEVLPGEYRRGMLAETDLPVLLSVSRPAPPSNPGTLWAALGLAPRLAVDLAISAPLVPALVTDLAKPAQDMHLGVGRDATPPDPPKHPGPQPPAANGMPVPRPDQHWRKRHVEEPR